MHILNVLWISMVMMVAAGAGGPGTPGGADTPGGGPANPYAAADAGGTISEIELTQSITIENTLVGVSTTVNYPAGWGAAVGSAELGMIIVGSDPAFINLVTENPDVDELPEHSGFMIVMAFSSELAGALGVDVSTSATLKDVVGMIAGTMGNPGTEVTREPYEITVGGVTIAQAEFGDDTVESVVMIVQREDVYILGIGATNPGELDTYKDIFTAITAAVEIR